MAKAFDNLEKATKKAFDNMAGKQPQIDPDLKFYEKLTPEAFDVISSVYGPENLTQYIMAMEAKRAKRGINGNSGQ